MTTSILDCSNKRLTDLPTLPSSLKILDCENNQLTELPTLPQSLKYLYCNNNQLTELPALPSSLKNLYCNNNQLTELPFLPPSLEILHCSNNNFKYSFEVTIKNINIFNKFKETYFKLKYSDRIERKFMRYRISKFKEELIQTVFHPRRMIRYLELYDFDINEL